MKPNVQCNYSNRVALIVDNSSTHRNLTNPGGIDFFPLPPNVTFVYQLMDQGLSEHGRQIIHEFMYEPSFWISKLEMHVENQTKSNTHGSNEFTKDMMPTCQM